MKDDTLNELSEGDIFISLAVVDVLDELSNDFSIGVRLEAESFSLKECLYVLVVGDDTIVDHNKFCIDRKHTVDDDQ